MFYFNSVNMSYVAQNKMSGSHYFSAPAEGLAHTFVFLLDSRRRSYVSKCIVSKVSYTTVQ